MITGLRDHVVGIMVHKSHASSIVNVFFILSEFCPCASECIYLLVSSLCLQLGLFTVINKYYSPESWKEFASENKDALKVIFVCCFSAVGCIAL